MKLLRKLCVGAASRIVVEEAAKLQVAQIVASRRQVNAAGGYIGMDLHELVDVAYKLSRGKTHVVRDHGGPMQGGFDDDGTADFDACIAAGFDALHLDVSELPRDDQANELRRLAASYGGPGRQWDVEIGGEHDEFLHNLSLLQAVKGYTEPSVVVASAGGWVWEDRQSGTVMHPRQVELMTDALHGYHVKAKAHNMDWLGRRARYFDVLDFVNVAPEYGLAETDAWLHVMSIADADDVLDFAYEGEKWKRWFDDEQGTWFDRARCALRYEMNEPAVLNVTARYREHEDYVRRRVRDAITRI